MKYEAILFDLDGTLLNTLDDLKDSVNYALSKSGYPIRTLPEIRQFVGNGVRKLVERSVPEGTAMADIDACFNIFVDYYSTHNRVKTNLYPGITALIRDLFEKNIKMAIVTNKLQSASEILQKDFFDPYIKVVIGDMPGRNKKPDPAGVLEAMKLLGIEDKRKVLYVGDSEVDAQTAINSGLDYVLCLWGFRDMQQLEKYSPVTFINNPKDLLEYL